MAGAPRPVKHPRAQSGAKPCLNCQFARKAGLRVKNAAMSHRIQKKDASAHAARLAEQLRANLRRRKAQAREVGAEPDTSADEPPPAAEPAPLGPDPT